MLGHDIGFGVTPLVRTHFSDDAAWRETVLAARAESPEGFQAAFGEVADPALRDISVADLVERVADEKYLFLLVADERTLRDPEHPILVLDLHDEPGRTFRVVPAQLWSVENNLSICNMDFFEFADHADADGVFRGF